MSDPYALLYSGKLSREKTFLNFAVLWLFAKVFSVKFGGVASFGGTSGQSVKVLSTKIFFHQFVKVFSHESFPLHGTLPAETINGSKYYMFPGSPHALNFCLGYVRCVDLMSTLYYFGK